MSSRSGNKGIVSSIVQGCDIHIQRWNLCCLIVNAHSIPSRMAVIDNRMYFLV